MNINKYGSIFLTPDEMFESIYKGKLKDFKNIHLDQHIVLPYSSNKGTIGFGAGFLFQHCFEPLPA